MGLKGLAGISGCVVLGFFLALIVFVVVLLALFIELFLPFGKDLAWAWMLNTPQQTSRPVNAPASNAQPVVVGSGAWCVTKAYQETQQEDHFNHGRVQGYVRDANGSPMGGVPVHVAWDGDEGGITEYTDTNGYYVIILSPGSYFVTIGDGTHSPRVYFRTNLKARYGHITYDVDFQTGSCSNQFPTAYRDPRQPCGTPVEGPITAGFQDPNYYAKFGREHEGIDFAVPLNTPVHSTMSGKVIGAGKFDGGYGNMVQIQNGAWEVMFEHLAQVQVNVGDWVALGQVIGLSGSTGESTGPHVHYEVHENGLPVDPLFQLTENGYATNLCAVSGANLGATMNASQLKSTSITVASDDNWRALSSFPQAPNNNGQCIHWFPTTHQSEKVVDTFMPILEQMGMKWTLILQDPGSPQANDYLLEKLRAAGIMPIVRLVTPVGPTDPKSLGQTVAHLSSLGVRYFQIYNEPNSDGEWGVSEHSPESAARYWAAAAQTVLTNGGLPGLPPLAPDGSDLDYIRRMLKELNRMGRYDLMRAMWISVHNYGAMNADGFFRFRKVQDIAREVLGHTLPMLGTEGGLGTAEQTAQIINAQFDFMRTQRDPYLFAYCPWLIGNSIGGGKDETWESQAWCIGTLDKPLCRVQIEPPLARQ